MVVQVTARVSNPPPLKLQSFDGLLDHSCMEDQRRREAKKVRYSKWWTLGARLFLFAAYRQA